MTLVREVAARLTDVAPGPFYAEDSSEGCILLSGTLESDQVLQVWGDEQDAFILLLAKTKDDLRKLYELVMDNLSQNFACTPGRFKEHEGWHGRNIDIKRGVTRGARDVQDLLDQIKARRSVKTTSITTAAAKVKP